MEEGQPVGLAANKAVERGDKSTRRVRVRVLALRENPRRDRVRVLALLENPRRDRVRVLAYRENPRRERVLDRWFEARGGGGGGGKEEKYKWVH